MSVIGTKTKPIYIFLALGAIVLWSCFAMLNTHVAHLPALLVNGIGLSFGGVFGLIRVKDWRVPTVTLLIGIGGIFGSQFFLVTAFRHAPMVEANLVNYTWPLLMVMVSPLLLRGYRLNWRHILGSLLGLAGTIIMVTKGRFGFVQSGLFGYLSAFAAAMTWAIYSLVTKRLPAFPSGAVGMFCLCAGAASIGIHCVIGGGAAGFTAICTADWIYLGAMGVGPMGMAFFLWDAALKRGDPRVMGALSYLTPMLSTLFLVAFGGQALTVSAAAAMILVIVGACIGAVQREKAGSVRGIRTAPEAPDPRPRVRP